MELNLVFSTINEVSNEALIYIFNKFNINFNKFLNVDSKLDEQIFNKKMIIYLRIKNDEFILCEESVYQYKLNIIVTNQSLHEFDMEANDLINIFFSTHRAESNVKSLSVHTIGNFSKKPKMAPFTEYFGGFDFYLMNWLFLSMNYNYLKSGMDFNDKKIEEMILKSDLYELSKELNQKSESFDSDIVFEATHHGPKNPNKIIFYEIGSTIIEWKDKDRIKFYVENFFFSIKNYDTFVDYVEDQREKFFNAKDVMINTNLAKLDFSNVDKSFFESKYHPFFKVFVLGGNHYCSEMNKLVLKNKVILGPVISKISLEEINFELLDKIFVENDFDFILVDEKGLGSYKSEIFDNLEKRYSYKFNQGFVKLKDLKKIKKV